LFIAIFAVVVIPTVSKVIIRIVTIHARNLHLCSSCPEDVVIIIIDTFDAGDKAIELSRAIDIVKLRTEDDELPLRRLLVGIADYISFLKNASK